MANAVSGHIRGALHRLYEDTARSKLWQIWRYVVRSLPVWLARAETSHATVLESPKPDYFNHFDGLHRKRLRLDQLASHRKARPQTEKYFHQKFGYTYNRTSEIKGIVSGTVLTSRSIFITTSKEAV